MNATAQPREGQTFTGGSWWVRYANFVKLPHTLFALPFALVGATLASYVAPVTLRAVAWMVLAFTSARFAAMGFNRIVDREWDARNPRTAMRELPRGTIGVREAALAVAAASAVFVISAAMLNPLCLWLSPIALAWVLGYSYTKRFTRLAHLWLGAGLSIAPAGGYLALTGRWSEPWWLLPALAVAVATWVGGFDIIYALPDRDFDRREGLHSLPAALGVVRALTLARALHVVAVIARGVAALALPVPAAIGTLASALWLAGIGVVAVLLVYEHTLVNPADPARLDAAFFTINSVLSLTFLVFVLAGRLLQGGTAVGVAAS